MFLTYLLGYVLKTTCKKTLLFLT